VNDFPVAYYVLRGKDILNFGAIFMVIFKSRPFFPREGSCDAHWLCRWILVTQEGYQSYFFLFVNAILIRPY